MNDPLLQPKASPEVCKKKPLTKMSKDEWEALCDAAVNAAEQLETRHRGSRSDLWRALLDNDLQLRPT